MNKKLGKRIGAIVLSLAIVIGIIFSAALEAFAYTPTTGTVTSDNVKVRESASTTAKQVSSLKNGDVIDIVDEATDASGYVWYKIRVNKSEYGYVRSDLIKKEGGSSSSTTTTTDTSTSSSETTTKTTESNSSAASLPETSVVSVDQKSATVLADSANVRKGAGTGYDVVGKVTKGTTVTITGEATGTDSKTWYQITFGDKTGFLRSDLLEISDAPVEVTEVAEGENTEGTENAEGENAEGENQETETSSGTGVASEVGDGTYSLVYLTDEEGNGVWYLYDNVQSTRVKVNDLVEVAGKADSAIKTAEKYKRYPVIIIILGILVAILVGGVVYLALKLRDSLYYEDEEEEYDRYSDNRRDGGMRERVPARRDRDVEKDDESKKQRPRRNPEDDREERTVRPARPRRSEDEYENRSTRREREEAPERPSRRDREEAPERPLRRDRDEEVRPSRRPEEDDRDRRDSRRDDYDRPKPSPKRRAKNFIGDEDDFEFEFLDLDDDK
ncbi:SH3 domain-containing protein [Butyrivibrio proteoclasticus]|uniref:SH3 domain-containing protein n=1 Tax=Butyrivibrio proteoclasticus TaxID=43305 RepID=UPI00047EAC0D|nr:SH3 domain-containing protein [Butyrivibrio proteoclasticus]